jgi:ribosomal-protein-serine acetyltransferase
MTIKIDQNLTLELTAEKHAKVLYDAVDNNREHLSKFLPWVGNMQSVNDFQNYIKSCEILYLQGKEVSFVIISNDDTVGRIGLHHLDTQNKNAAIGYWLTKNAEGKGIITKSCEAIINYGFQKLELQRIEIKAAVENLRSRAIPEKFRFTKEGILRQAELVNGKFLDLVLYSILRSEWMENKKHLIH